MSRAAGWGGAGLDVSANGTHLGIAAQPVGLLKLGGELLVAKLFGERDM